MADRRVIHIGPPADVAPDARAESRESKRPGIVIRRAAVSPTDGPAAKAPNIRIVATPSEPVRIEHPLEGETLRSDRIRLQGRGPRQVRLEVWCNDELLTRVDTDELGQFRLERLKVPGGPVALRVESAGERGGAGASAAVSFVVQALPPIQLTLPADGQVLEEKALRVTGQAYPGERLLLETGALSRELTAGTDGAFQCNLPLRKAGKHVLTVRYVVTPDEGSRSVKYAWWGVDFPNQKDTFTGDALKPGADIVRCATCRYYFYRTSWEALGRCPEGCASTSCWDRSHPDFAKLARYLPTS